jgi:phosphate transport system protein
MKEYFIKEIDEVKTDLIKMASLVDEQIEKVFSALEYGNISFCQFIKIKDREVDAYNELLQTKCENLLARFQPVASDLRFVISTIMINNQLERCGDLAVNISNRIKETSSFRNLIMDSGIVEMSRHARIMISKSIDSFIHNDIEMAKRVISNDIAVDRLNKSLFDFFVSKMQEDIDLVEPSAHLLILVRNIERLADHATNIAEDVLFQVEAKVVSNRRSLKTEEVLSEVVN